MRRESGIKWLYVDLNSFFASVEQQENPNLRNKPVAVVPADTDYTCVIAASYEAKAYGIRTGLLVKKAKIMCPNLHCIPAHHDIYVAYHNRIVEEVIKHTPIDKIYSIDELSSCLPLGRRSVTAANKVAQNIKNGIWNNVGFYINCSIGCAPNAFLAKIACNMQKPDGLTLLPQETLPAALFSLKLTDITGIGPKMGKRLNRLNISSIYDFVQLNPKQAQKAWGSIFGESMWYLLHGYDFKQPTTNTSIIGHSRILNPKTRTLRSAKIILRALTIKSAQRLQQNGLHTGCVSISLHTNSGAKLSRDTKFSATNNTFTILHFVDLLWGKVIPDIANIHHSHHTKIKKVSVCLSKLNTKRTTTRDLFINTYTPNTFDRDFALCEALGHLQNKYKKQVVTLGISPEIAAKYVETKIAFSHIPTQQEFWN